MSSKCLWPCSGYAGSQNTAVSPTLCTTVMVHSAPPHQTLINRGFSSLTAFFPSYPFLHFWPVDPNPKYSHAGAASHKHIARSCTCIKTYTAVPLQLLQGRQCFPPRPNPNSNSQCTPALPNAGDAQERQQKTPAVADVQRAPLLSMLQRGASNTAQKQSWGQERGRSKLKKNVQ